ncbi:MAG TPA: hypothetical protein VNJ01_04280 [Bacteriovoracaceae bacterium]|nr:hypothetical protein [Bacteriovoracaceae bacterium]
MKPFLTSRMKTIEISLLLLLGALFYLIYPSLEAVSLFSFGYIWNWAGSQDLGPILENHRYRFSMLKLVTNLQVLIQKPFQKAPQLLQGAVRIFPAGIFWLMVIYFNESSMPWWSTFVGSLCFEVLDYLWLLKRKPEVEFP